MAFDVDGQLKMEARINANVQLNAIRKALCTRAQLGVNSWRAHAHVRLGKRSPRSCEPVKKMERTAMLPCIVTAPWPEVAAYRRIDEDPAHQTAGMVLSRVAHRLNGDPSGLPPCV